MMADRTMERRIGRELKTVRAMIGIHCRGLHRAGGDLCPDCEALWQYARQRVELCPFRPDKPTCLRCPVHCYRPEMRERIRAVMRYAGPRMSWRHPLLTLFHFLVGRKPPPSVPPRDPGGKSVTPGRAVHL